jgi:hypothetical protein
VNSVCVKGSGAVKSGAPAERVYAMIYFGGAAPDPVHQPPTNAHSVQVDANGDWCFGYIPHADSGDATFKDNTVWVWAKFGTQYDFLSQAFSAKCSTTLPVCCGSSSSSSSSGG